MLHVIAQLAAKREAMALVGGTIYREPARRRAQPKNDKANKRWSDYCRMKYLLPDAGAPPSIDRYGRPHIIPQWTGYSDNHEFLEALEVRISKVSVFPV